MSKQEIVSFKVDPALAQALREVPNKSEFIRSAVLAAFDGTCPLCLGTGFLTATQRQHWETFAATHSLEKCGECDARHIVCSSQVNRPHHGGHGTKG